MISFVKYTMDMSVNNGHNKAIQHGHIFQLLNSLQMCQLIATLGSKPEDFVNVSTG